MLRLGEKVPDFKAQAYQRGDFRDISLSQLHGKWTVLFFYPLDFTFVCPTELKAFAADYDKFKEANAELVAASVDSVFSHKAWFENELQEVSFPVIGDITKQVARSYGVLDEEKGVALRGTFIIDPEGVLQYMVISGLGLGRSTDETLRVLKALQTGEMCPANWKPGQKTLGKAS
ncbi:MAG: peroxiredoxin [Acidobacteriota bacterium]